MSEFAGRSVVVTGGTGGIGGAIAQAFAALGASVVVTGLVPGEISSFSHQAPHIRAVQLDVSSPDQVRRLVEPLDRVDVLVNAAGTIMRGGQEFEPSMFAAVIDVNVNGVMRMCSACYPKLKAVSGCIVNLASMWSYFGSRFTPAYSASKGAVVQLTKSLAVAWASDGIRVNAVAPGWITTPMTSPVQNDAERSAAIVARTPLGRWGTPKDVAGPVLFLCSDAARFVTGVVLPVDGGYSIS